MAKVNTIQSYREQRGLTQRELGEHLGVTRQTIAAWEKGERQPTLAQLAKIAQALAIAVDLLIEQAVTQDGDMPTLLFRADTPDVLSIERRAHLTRRAEDYAEVEHLVGELPVLPESRPLEGYDPVTIERLAGEVRDWLGVQGAPLGDVLALLEAKGLKIILEPLPNDVSGFSAYTDAWGGVIFVNGLHPPERQYFTALHELAHLILHRREYHGPTTKPKRGDPREKAAHHLAAAVLLPREAIEHELHVYRHRWLPEPLLMDLKTRYGVSVRTILLRAADLGVISKRQAGQQIGTITKTYGKEAEPGEIRPPQHLSRLERLVYGALYQEKLTTSRAAEILQRTLLDVRYELAKWQGGAPA